MYHSWTNSRVKRCTLFFKPAPEKTYNSRELIVPRVPPQKKKKITGTDLSIHSKTKKEHSRDNMSTKGYFFKKQDSKLGGGVLAQF